MSAPAYKPEDGKYYAFGIFDVTQHPPELVDIKPTRKKAREFVEWREDADNLRIRRGQYKPYQT